MHFKRHYEKSEKTDHKLRKKKYWKIIYPVKYLCPILTSAGKDMEKLEPSCSADGIVKLETPTLKQRLTI